MNNWMYGFITILHPLTQKKSREHCWDLQKKFISELFFVMLFNDGASSSEYQN
jgi:hypothetical protein